MITTNDFTLSIVALIAASGVAILSFEDVRSSSAFGDASLMSWRVSSRRSRWLTYGMVGQLINFILTHRHFRVLLYLRVISACAVVIGAVLGHLLVIPIIIILLALVAQSLRSPYGLDGAHQMHLLLFGALTFASLESDFSDITSNVVIIFISCQALLAYTVSGMAKLTSNVWRSGDALIGIMSTKSYGNAYIFRLLKRYPVSSTVACWGVILLECIMPIAFIVGGPYFHVVLGGALLFHFLAAIVMGLNGFLFAFLATFPAMVFFREHLLFQ